MSDQSVGDFPTKDPSPNDETLGPDTTSSGPSLPASIGRYRIIRLLGQGGMGAVYEAEQDMPRRMVALKVMKVAWASPDLLRRFEQESHALGLLHHPGIAQVYDAGSADTGFGLQPFFAMELVDGQSLREFAAAHQLTARQRLSLMIEICDAVQHAHDRGIIHRDLKPGNILVDRAGKPKILDFGIARITESDIEATQNTDMGELLGTLPYMSPEQTSGDSSLIDKRSDVYALGIVLYELLSGKMPYLLSRNLHEIVQTIQQTDPAPLSSISSLYRGDIETIVGKALEKDRTRRYASTAELAADIQRYLDDLPITAKPASAAYQLKKFARRHTALVTGIALVFLALAAGVIASTWEAVRARRAEASAQAVNDFLQNDLLAQASAFNQSGTKNKPDPDLKVRTALDRAAQNIQGKFDKQPQVEAAIRDTIGQTYNDLGLYPEARTQLERALELRRKVLGPDDAKTLVTESHLALVAGGQGKFAESEGLYDQALQAQRRVLGTEKPETLRSMSGLATLYYDNGKFAQSEVLRSQILDIQRRVVGPEKPETLQAMSALGAAFQGEGKYVQAEGLQQQALDIKRKVLGAEDLSTLSTALDLGTTYAEDGKFDQAEQLIAQVLDIYRRVLGPRHPATLSTLNVLAGDYLRQGKYEQASELYAQALELDRQVLGPEHASTLKASVNLSLAYLALNKYPQAEALASQAVEISRRVRGKEDFITIGAMTCLAEAYEFEGKYGQAEAVILPEIEIIRHIRGPEHRNTLVTTAALASVYTMQGKYSLAEPLYQRTLAISARVLGPEDYNTLSTLVAFDTMYQLRGNYAQAEIYARQAFAGRRHALGPTHPGTLYSESLLALALLSQNKYAEAEPLAREVLETDKKDHPEDWQRHLAESLLGESLVGERKFAEGRPLLREGFQGMKAQEQSIAASERFVLDIARKWLDLSTESRGKQKQAD